MKADAPRVPGQAKDDAIGLLPQRPWGEPGRVLPLLLILAALGAAALLWLAGRDRDPKARTAPDGRAVPQVVAPAVPRASTNPIAPSSSAETESLDAGIPTGSIEAEIERVEGLAAAARADRTQALSDLAAAETDLLDSEREIEALESFISDLEASGEDPADHAEEGMRRFNPVLLNYEKRAARLEAAERTVQEATARLQAAEERLESLRDDAPRR